MLQYFSNIPTYMNLRTVFHLLVYILYLLFDMFFSMRSYLKLPIYRFIIILISILFAIIFIILRSGFIPH